MPKGRFSLKSDIEPTKTAENRRIKAKLLNGIAEEFKVPAFIKAKLAKNRRVNKTHKADAFKQNCQTDCLKEELFILFILCFEK